MILNRTLKAIFGEYASAAYLPILLLKHLNSINDCNAYLKKKQAFWIWHDVCSIQFV
jgi:hypothetical protein